MVVLFVEKVTSIIKTTPEEYESKTLSERKFWIVHNAQIVRSFTPVLLIDADAKLMPILANATSLPWSVPKLWLMQIVNFCLLSYAGADPQKNGRFLSMPIPRNQHTPSYYSALIT